MVAGSFFWLMAASVQIPGLCPAISVKYVNGWILHRVRLPGQLVAALFWLT